MARTSAELPKGTRVTDYMSLGVLTKTFPLRQVNAVLAAQGRASHRQRELPAHVMVYYVIALAVHASVLSRGAALFVGRFGLAAGTGAGVW